MSEYDTDIALWSEHQGTLLRRRAAGELINEADLDWQNIAEEIESLGRSERSAIKSCIATIIEHLANLEASVAIEPRIGWIQTVRRSRSELEELLEDSPSLRREIDGFVAKEHGRVLRLVGASLDDYGEIPWVTVDDIHYTTEQVLGPWVPR